MIPPPTVSNELIEKYAHPQGYETLTPWLEDETQTDTPEGVDRYSDEPNEIPVEGLDRPSNIESLVLNPLEVEAPESKEKKDYLADVLAGQGKVSEQTAAYPEDQFWTYRDGFLQIFQQRMGRTADQTEKAEIVTLAGVEGASLDVWDKSFKESILNYSGSNKPPLARIIEVYQCGGDYEKWRKWKYTPEGLRTDGEQEAPQTVEIRDVKTGELIETKTLQ